MRTSLLERLALRVVAALERHLPDALIFALLATGLVLLAALGLSPSGQSRLELCGKLVDGWGSGFFSLLPFTLQMVMIIICGHTVASAPPEKFTQPAFSLQARPDRSPVAGSRLTPVSGPLDVL